MRGLFLTLGVACLASAAALSAVGHYDGLLGATPFDAFPAPGEAPSVIEARVVVDGTPDDARRLHDQIDDDGAHSDQLESHFDDGTVVPARFESDDGRTLVFLQVQGAAPAPGQVLVVEGPVETLRLPLADGGHLDVGLLVLVHTVEIREPLVFKNG